MNKFVLMPLYACLLTLGLLSACTNNSSCDKTTASGENGHCAHEKNESTSLKTAENQQLMDEVMQVHDEMMPKLPQLNQLQQKMLEMARTTKKSSQKQQFTDVAKALGEAENAMFAWMEQFPSNLDSLPAENIKVILEEQKISVNRMKNQMLDALKKSDEVIVNVKSSDI